jgi:hypothetical protein
MKCPRCKHIDCHAEWCQTTADSNAALIDLLPADRLKQVVSEVLGNAIDGRHPGLRTEDGFIRWGLVEKIIHQEIDAVLK